MGYLTISHISSFLATFPKTTLLSFSPIFSIILFMSLKSFKTAFFCFLALFNTCIDKSGLVLLASHESFPTYFLYIFISVSVNGSLGIPFLISTFSKLFAYSSMLTTKRHNQKSQPKVKTESHNQKSKPKVTTNPKSQSPIPILNSKSQSPFTIPNPQSQSPIPIPNPNPKSQSQSQSPSQSPIPNPQSPIPNTQYPIP